MRNEIFTKTYEAEGAINGYRLVKFGAADGGVLQASAATDALIGVAKPLDEAYASGDRLEVVRAGIAEVEYGGTVTRGDNLTSDANGKAITAAYGEQIIGRAEVSGVSGDIGSVMIGSAGAAGNFRAEVTLTTAQVKALNATPITLVAAPGAGKAIVPTLITAFLDWNAAAYDGIAAGEDLVVRYTDGSGAAVATIEATGFLDATADAVRWALPTSTAAFTPVANSPIVAHMATGEIATGDSPLKVRVDYKIIDTAW